MPVPSTWPLRVLHYRGLSSKSKICSTAESYTMKSSWYILECVCSYEVGIGTVCHSGIRSRYSYVLIRLFSSKFKWFDLRFLAEFNNPCPWRIALVSGVACATFRFCQNTIFYKIFCEIIKLCVWPCGTIAWLAFSSFLYSLPFLQTGIPLYLRS